MINRRLGDNFCAKISESFRDLHKLLIVRLAGNPFRVNSLSFYFSVPDNVSNICNVALLLYQDSPALCAVIGSSYNEGGKRY